MQDADVLLVALFVTYLPGLALLAALRVRRAVLLVALAPAASVGVAGMTGVVTALAGLRYGPAVVGAVTVLLAVLGVARARPSGLRRGSSAVHVLGVLMVLVGVGVGVGTWWGAMHELSTVPQEHDMVLHTVLAAYIERSGNAAPWELAPADVLTGSPVGFYPAGLHLLIAVTATATGGTVEAVNAMTVVVLAVVLAACAAALTAVAARQLRLASSTATLAAGVAALVASGLYRPTFHLMHDGGILSNAATLAMAPGVVAGVLLLPRLPWGSAVAVGISCAGLAWVHPSAVASVGVTVLAWWVGQALAAQGRRQLRGLITPLLVAGTSAGLLVAVALSPLLTVAGRTTGFPPDSGTHAVREALGSALGLTYGGHLDPQQSRAQATAAVLAVLGVVTVLLLRRGYGPVLAWAAWVLVTIGAFRSPAVGLDALITGFFYHALLRTWSHISVLVPVLAGLGIVLTANLVAVLVRRRLPLRARPTAVVLVLLAWMGYLLDPAADYAETNATALASRYHAPHFVRVDTDDRRAMDWLAARVQPGQRVLNSPNDGSTYLYIEHGIPVVNIYTLGVADVPYSYRLLESFRSYPADPAVRATVLELRVAWVYVDSEAPQIGSSGSPQGWAGASGFSLAPGLRDLEGLPGLYPVFRSGSVTVYSLDLDLVRSL